MSDAKVVKSNRSPKVVNSKVNFSMDTTRFKFNQTPLETPNGVITVFTLPSSEAYVSGLIEVFLDWHNFRIPQMRIMSDGLFGAEIAMANHKRLFPMSQH